MEVSLKFKVGDRVIDGTKDIGTIVSISDTSYFNCPIRVMFDGGTSGSYTTEGALGLNETESLWCIRLLSPLEKVMK